MQDGMEGVTIVATANDIAMLPPEFIRRFNEVFFVDLPGPEERWDIFTIHLGKRKRNTDIFTEKEKEILITATQGFTGAEIEKGIKDGIAASFYAGEKELTSEALLLAIQDTKPISKIMKKKVADLRKKAQGSFRFASSHAMEQAKSKPSKKENASGKTLDVDEMLKGIGGLSEAKENESKPAKTNSRFKRL